MPAAWRSVSIYMALKGILYMVCLGPGVFPAKTNMENEIRTR